MLRPGNPRVTSPEQSYEPGQPGEHIPRRVIKGGSHLCAPNYCLRYRPAARAGGAGGHRDRRTSASAASCARSAIPVRPDRRQRRREYPAGLVHLGPVLVPIGHHPAGVRHRGGGRPDDPLSRRRTDVAKPFEGVINVDVRDSVQNWGPYGETKAPEGAPSMLIVLYNDAG